MATEELVTAKLFNKFVKKFSDDTKVERQLRKQTLINTKEQLEEHTQAVKDLNKDIKEGNKIQDTAQEKKLQEQIDEIRELKKSTDQASEEYKELSKKETGLMKKFVSVQQEGADHDTTMAKRQDLISKRDKAAELIREEKDKDRGFASKKMMGLLSGIEKGIGGMWKKGKSAVGMTFKGALIATGLLLLLKFLESKKWQDVKKWIGKEGKEIFDTLTETLDAMYKYFAGPDSVFKRYGKIMDSMGNIFKPNEGGGDEDDQFHIERSWWAGITDAWEALDENMKSWEWALIGGLTLLTGYFFRKPLALLFKGGWALTKLGFRLLVGKWSIFAGMKWIANWFKNFPKVPMKQLEMDLKPPKGTWWADLSKKFVTAIDKFKSAVRIAIANAGDILAKLANKLPKGIPTDIAKNAPISKLGTMWKPAARLGGKGLVKTGQSLTRTLGQSPGSMLARFGKGGEQLGGIVSEKHLLAAAARMGRGVKIGGKAAKVGGFLAKKVPWLSFGIGAGLAAIAFGEGRYARAAVEMLSGIAGMVPGAGTMISGALDIGMAAEDLGTKQGILHDYFDKMGAYGDMSDPDVKQWKKDVSKKHITMAEMAAAQRKLMLARIKKSQAAKTAPKVFNPADFKPVGEGVTFEDFQKGLSASSSNLPEHDRIAMWMRHIKNSDYQGTARGSFVYAGKDDHSSVNMSVLGADTTTDTSIQSEWLSGP